MNYLLFTSFFIILIVDLVKCKSDCNTLTTCGECIGYPYMKCVWCTKGDMKEARCESEEHVKNETSWCPKPFLYNPEYLKKVSKNEDFKSIYDGSGVIQLMPQVINIKTRPGIPIDFMMSYKPGEDFPIDVYFLMDISYTMQAVKNELRNQAEEIRNKLRELSKNVQLGIGSFVEKPVFPYYDKHLKKKSISYFFKNNLPLTPNVDDFKKTIDDIPFGANYDDLEAGFDALMQVITCDEQIGWRNNSRRIIVYVSDSSYHSIGDGKMLGIIKPNDMQCHAKDGWFETALTLDYPSISQINVKALKNRIKIIFVAHSSVKDSYEPLEKYILDSKYEELKIGSKTGDIIERAYKEQAASVILDRNDWPSFIDLKLDPDCKSSSQINCKITPEQPVANISAILTVNKCPEKKNYKLEIVPRATSDVLTINLEIICECECEKKAENNSSKCNGAGSYQCGICICMKGRYGDDCSCDSGTETSEEHMKKCLANPTDIKPCSGRAICICGKCDKCPGFSGEHCEYDDSACPKFNNAMCAGHGKCTLGRCVCDNTLWGKDDCSCDMRNDKCIAPYSHEVCSGHGSCECGECVCNKIKEGTDERYMGKYCDSCDECAENRCKDLENYVYCYYMSETCDEFSNQTSRTDISMVNMTVFQSPPPEWRGAKRCEKLLDSNEAILFMFRNDDETGKLHILVQKELKPPNRANIIIAVSSAIAAVVFIGLLTVIVWKILIDLHDAREFKKFSEQAASEGYDVSTNPLYAQPTTNIMNPAYVGDTQS